MSISNANEALRRDLLKEMRQISERAKLPIDPDQILFGSHSNVIVVNSVAANFDNISREDLQTGVNVGLVYLDLPEEELTPTSSGAIPAGFYIVRVTDTRAELVDLSGKPVARELPVTITPGETTLRKVKVDLYVGPGRFRFSLHTRLVSVDVCLGRKC
jgi:hypothetical protein